MIKDINKENKCSNEYECLQKKYHELEARCRELENDANKKNRILYPSVDEKMIHQSELILNLPGIVFRCKNDVDWTMIYISDSCEEILGYSPDDFTKHNRIKFAEIVLPIYREFLHSKFEQILEKKDKFDIEYQIVTASGQIKWVWERAYGVYDENGKVKYFEGYIEDIHERKLVEESLRNSEEKHRILFSNSPDAYFILSDTVYVDCNLALCDMLSIDKLQILGKTPADFSPEYQPNGLLSSEISNTFMKEAEINGKALFEWVYKGIHNREYWVEVMMSVFSVKRKKMLFGAWRNISERKSAELSLKNSEAKLRFIFESLEDLYYQTDAAGNILILSPNVEKFTRWSASEIIGQNVLKFYHDQKTRDEMLKTVLEQGFVRDYELLLKSKDGEVVEVSVSVRAMYDTENNFIGVSGLIRDISKRKESERIILDSIQRYKLLADNISDIIWVFDVEKSKLEYISPSVEYFTGYSVEEAIAIGAEKLIVEDAIELMKLEMPMRINKYYLNDHSDDAKVYEFQLNCRDGALVWSEVTMKFFENLETGNINLLGVARNIDKRKLIEKQVHAYTEQLELMNATKDKFFSIVAHDLRNPLGSFRDMASVMFENYDMFDDAERKDSLKMLKDTSNNLFMFLENLLEWSRSQRGLIHFTPINVNLHFIANNCIELLELGAIKKNISLINSLSETNEIIADVNLLIIVIRNLISNAIKFTKEGGVIEIGMNCEPTNNQENYNTSPVIWVRDNGIGMSPEVVSQLFRIDSGLTTKGTMGESGTGLGLILCKEFVEKHGGKIWVESEIGIGSTFYFTVPLVGNEAD